MSIKHDYGRLLTFIVLLIVSSSTAIAQELMKVTGVVVDQNAEPLIGVTVRVKDDAKSGTVTGLDGDFSIMVQKGKTLVFSYLGYQTKEVAAITSKLKINMKEDNKMLDDVVVVGYGVQKKSSVTGAISQVKKEDIENRTITNAKAALQGKTAGVQVISSSSAPGSSPTIRIRGYSSNVSSDPLYCTRGSSSPTYVPPTQFVMSEMGSQLSYRKYKPGASSAFSYAFSSAGSSRVTLLSAVPSCVP